MLSQLAIFDNYVWRNAGQMIIRKFIIHATSPLGMKYEFKKNTYCKRSALCFLYSIENQSFNNGHINLSVTRQNYYVYNYTSSGDS